MNKPTLERFEIMAEVLNSDQDDSVQLDAAVLELAATFVPELRPEVWIARLDEMGHEAAALVRTGNGPPVPQLIDFLARDQGYFGREPMAFEDPNNSFLNEVLVRRTGLPITLAVIYLEVGRRAGVALEGVGFPGRFVVRAVGDSALIIDPFVGELVSTSGIETLLINYANGDDRSDPRVLPPSSKREILHRMLNNLKLLYVHTKAWEHVLACSTRILLLAPESALEYCNRGTVYETLECVPAAIADYERFLALAPQDPNAKAVQARLVALRRVQPTVH